MGVVSEVVFPGHEFDAGGGTDWGGVAVVETDAVFGEGVKMGCFVVLGSVAGEAFPGDVISHDEDDIWWLRRKS